MFVYYLLFAKSHFPTLYKFLSSRSLLLWPGFKDKQRKMFKLMLARRLTKKINIYREIKKNVYTQIL